jgi:hypothetical protein
MRQIPKFHKLVLPLAISAALVACGSDSKGSSAAPTTVAGASSKGIVIGGIVNAYPITNTGTVDKDISLAEPATTAEDGSYSLTLNSNYVPGTAIYVEITAGDGTLMRCDLAKCGANDFGDTYTLASNFAMSAALPKADGGSVAVNITPLTDIAAKLTLDKVATGGGSASPSEAALGSNAQVANLLGLDYVLIDQAIVDITNADAVNSASEAALDYNLKSAAAIAAVLKENTTLSVEEAVANFVQQFRDAGIAGKEDTTPNPSLVSLEELLEEALILLDKVKSVPGVKESPAITGSSTKLTTAKNNAQQHGSTAPSQGKIPEDIGSEGLRASKLFVEQVRNVGNATLISTKQEAFANEVDLASQAISADSDVVTEGLGMGLYAIGNAYQQYQETPDEEKPSSIEINGITVAISKSGDTVSLAVDQVITLAETEVTLNLNVSNGYVITEEYERTTENNIATHDNSGSATGLLSVSGSAASADVSITIAEGTFSGSLVYDNQNTELDNEQPGIYDDKWDDEFSITNLDAKLSITLAQLTGDNKVSFTGSMGLKLGELTSTEDGSYTSNYNSAAYTNHEHRIETLNFNDFEVSLAGEFSDTVGNVIKASLAANIDNFKGACEEDENYYNYNYSYSYECDVDETATSYAMASLSIIFELNIDGIDDDVKVEFNANRNGLKTGEASLKLSYQDGKQLTLVYQGGFDGSSGDYDGEHVVTLRNHNGVSMTLTEADDKESITGNIKHGGASFATVSDSSGAVIIRYSDGSFETIM